MSSSSLEKAKAMFERLLNHTCDIFHRHEGSVKDFGYGIKSVPVDLYSTEPDCENVKCHFHSESINVVQNDPAQNIIAERKVDFALNTDIRLNDKVIYDELTYYAGVINNVRNHHLTVTLQRKGVDANGC